MQWHPIYTWEGNILLSTISCCHSSLYLQSTFGSSWWKRPYKFDTVLHCIWIYLTTLFSRQHQNGDWRGFQTGSWQSRSGRNQLYYLRVCESPGRRGRAGYKSYERESFSGRGARMVSWRISHFQSTCSLLSIVLYAWYLIFQIFQWTLLGTWQSKSHDSAFQIKKLRFRDII